MKVICYRHLSLASALALCVSAASATTYYFDENGATAGSGVTAGGSYDGTYNAAVWSTSSAGTSATAAAADRNSLVFSAGSDAAGLGYTVTGSLSEPNLIQVSSGYVTLSASWSAFSSPTVRTLNGTSLSITSTGNDFYTKTLNFEADGTSTITLNSISTNSGRSGGLTTTGTGLVTITGGASARGITVNANSGELRVRNGNAMFTSGYSATVTVNSGGTLELDNNITVSNNAITIKGGGYNGLGALNNYSGTNHYNNTITLGANATISSVTGTTLQIGGAIGGGYALTIGTTTSAATTEGASGTVLGGTVVVAQNATYSGGTTINAGNLIMSSGKTLAANSNMSIASGANWYLNGTSQTLGQLAGSGTVGETWAHAGTDTLTVGGGDASSTFDGVIAGGDGSSIQAIALVKAGNGTLALTGTNTYTGTTAISGGTLQIGNGGTSGSLASGGAITDNANLAFNRTDNYGGSFSNVITGSGTLTVMAGTLTLAGTYANSGGFVINSGATVIMANNNEVSSIPLTVNGTLNFNNGQIFGALNGSGTITENTNSLYTNSSSNGSFSGAINGNGGYIKQGTGTEILSGTNGFTGGVTISGGILQLGSGGALNGTTGLENPVTFGSSTTGVLALGGNSVTVSSLTGSAGGPVVENANGTGVSNATLTVGNSTNAGGTFAGVIQDGSGGGTLALTKAGSGMLTLSGLNTYTGATNINAGTLALSGSGAIANSLLITVASGGTLDVSGVTGGNWTVAASQTLAGAGTVNGTITVGGSGNIHPGGTGTLSTGALTISGGTYTCDLIAIASDKLAVSGALTLSGAALNLNVLATPAASGYIIATYGSLNGNFAGLAEGASVTVGTATYIIKYADGGNNITLSLPPASGYNSWIGGFAGLSDSTPGGNPSGDGISNLMKYVLNGDPRVSDPSILPGQTEDGSGNLVFTYTRLHESTGDTTQIFEYGSDLSNWTDVSIPASSGPSSSALPAGVSIPASMAPSASVTITPSGSTDTVVVTLPTNSVPVLFARLKVTQP